MKTLLIIYDKNFDDDYKDTEGYLDMNDRSLVEVEFSYL